MSLESLAAKCDSHSCRAKTYDYMADKWIVLKGEVTEFAGRDRTGQAKAAMQINNHGERHFCSWACFQKLGEVGRSK